MCDKLLLYGYCRSFAKWVRNSVASLFRSRCSAVMDFSSCFQTPAATFVQLRKVDVCPNSKQFNPIAIDRNPSEGQIRNHKSIGWPVQICAIELSYSTVDLHARHRRRRPEHTVIKSKLKKYKDRIKREIKPKRTNWQTELSAKKMYARKAAGNEQNK